ncbi:MAG: hypothetical protein V4631_08680 [Pseudomonadota bacterium]
MNPRHIVMGLAVACAAALAVFGDKTPDSGVAEAVERAPAAVTVVAVAAQDKKTGASEPAILRLIPRATLIGEGDEAMGRSADVFGRQDWTPPPPPPPKAGPMAPPPPPMAPPLPFTYLGKAAQGGQWEIFLAIGDKTYVVRDKMVIDGMYRVDAIAPPNLTLTYLPLNQVQQLNIGVLD